MQRGEPKLQFTPNVQCHEGCRAIRSRCSCLQRPSLKIRLQLQFHRRADMEHEPSQRALIIISQCHRHFIIRLVDELGRNLSYPRRSRFNRLRRIHRIIVIFRNWFRKFLRLFLLQLLPDFHRLRCFLLLAFSLTRGDLTSLLLG